MEFSKTVFGMASRFAKERVDNQSHPAYHQTPVDGGCVMSLLGSDDEDEDIFRLLAHVEPGQFAKPDQRTGRVQKNEWMQCTRSAKKKKRQHNDDLLVELEEAEQKARPVESNNIIYHKHTRSCQKMRVATTKAQTC